MQITPKDLKIKTVSEDTFIGVFEFEPLPKGFGYTLGNTLRRVLLTSMEGAAITQIKVNGTTHQFSTLEGVKEDVVEIILNLKKVRFMKHSENPEVAILKATGPGPITAASIESTADIEVINKDQHIATLADKKTNLNIELIVESGVGYSPMEERQTSKVGVVVIDALFSPVLSANMQVEETRAGGRIDLDKLILNVETDGSIKPSDAVYKSAGILSEFFGILAKWEQEPTEEEKEEEAKTTSERPHVEDIAIDELPLQTRTINALKKSGIESLAELARKSDDELSDIKNLGEKSITEIDKLLKKEKLRE